ncbi:MAG: NAD(P)-binding domain-containing protein [Methanobrevibacter sp.]|jgi:3-hydroxyisobutyrate dehydrogenase-like beta-hydroxyacid dehydrogenase|nr:NAD(P)-binding domain-containing protein [Methanobrevibacter sp.]
MDKKLIVGFIGFGEVGSVLSSKLSENGCDILSSSKGRSPKTKNLIDSSNVKDLNSYLDVAKSCDILISSVSPANAIAIAEKYGKYADIFIDLNNISPSTAKKIANVIDEDKFINGSIIGKVNAINSIIYVSGPISEKIAILNEYGLNIKSIGNDIEDASIIKVLRSIYTKGISAILIETCEIAKKLDLEKELFDVIAITEGKNFELSAKSRIKNSINNSKRKYEELEEILEFLNTYSFDNKKIDDELLVSIKNKFKNL